MNILNFLNFRKVYTCNNNKYIVQKQIGKGSTCRVYKVELGEKGEKGEKVGKNEKGEKVEKGEKGEKGEKCEKGASLKFALKKFNKNSQTVIEQEIIIHSSLNHPNIVKLYDYSTTFTNNKSQILILEYLHSINNNNNKYSSLKEKITDIKKGLIYLHSNGIVHRDLKIENLFIDDNNNIKIGDFGASLNVAQVCKCKDYCYLPIIGTLYYMAPEIFNKQIECVNIYKIDIWALGVLIYKMITSKFPFEIYDKNMNITFENIKTNNYNRKLLNCSPYQKMIDNIFIISPQQRLDINTLKV